MKRIAVIRAVSWEVMKSALESLGVPINHDADQVENTVGRCNTPPQETDMGIISTIMITPEQLELVRGMVPNMLCDWLEGETEEVIVIDTNPETGAVTETSVERPIPWPVYNIKIIADDGTESIGKQYASIFQ